MLPYSISQNGQSVFENSDYNKKDQDIYIYFDTLVDGKLNLKVLKHNDAPMKHQLFIGTSCDDLTLVERTSYEFNHNIDNLDVVKGQQYIIKLVKRSKGYSRYTLAFDISTEPEPMVLNSLTLSSDATTITVGDTTTLSVIGSYSDGSTKNVTNDVSFSSSNTSIASISGSTLSALAEGSTIVSATLDGITSNSVTLSVEAQPQPVVLNTLILSIDNTILKVGESATLSVIGNYSDNSTQDLSSSVSYNLSSSDVASVNGTTLNALAEGYVGVIATLDGITSNSVALRVESNEPPISDNDVNTSNFNFTHFGYRYLSLIPNNSTKTEYDPDRFCMITGQILDASGNPISGVKVTIHGASEYGSQITDGKGQYYFATEGGLKLTMRYSKAGYTTIDRKVYAQIADWSIAPTVTMLQEDSKVTTIDFTQSTPQSHVSTVVSDERGSRSTTLIFNGITKATVNSPDGSSRELTTIDVKATEFYTPESMPADLPKETAYTYCSDIKVGGVSDDENVTFDKPVTMLVDNFLGFDVGMVVPIGYYDRNQGKWVGSENGVVVALLDTDSDGKIDALDSTGDGQPNDLNGDGSTSDEVVGMTNNPKFAVGQSYWMAKIGHFTPWDHNWPWAPPEDAEKPDQKDPKTDDNPPNDCKIDVKSYVTGKSRVFHEDIPIAGTNLTLHYSSKGTDGYKHIIDASVDTSTIPGSVVGATVTLNIAGRRFTQTPNLAELNNLTFTWDGKDAVGNSVSGEVTGVVTVTYLYNLVYYRSTTQWSQAWAQVGSSATGVRGRSTIGLSTSKSIQLNVEPKQKDKNNIASGWVFDQTYKNITTKGILQGIDTKKFIEQKDGLLFAVELEPEQRLNYLPIEKDRFFALGLYYPSSTLSYSGNKVVLRAFTYIDGQVSNAENTILGTFSNFDFRLSYTNRPPNGYDAYAYYRDTIYEGLSDRSYLDASQSIIELKEKVRNRYLNNDPYMVATNSAGGNIYRNDNYWTLFGSSNQLITKLDELYTLDQLLDLSSMAQYQHIGLKEKDIVVFDRENGYIFDSQTGQLLKVFDNRLKIVLKEYGYDVKGKLISITNQFNETITISRDIEGNPTQITAPNGQETYLSIDEQGNLVEVRYEDSSAYTFSYFDGSLMDIMRDPNGNSVQHIFDANGRIVEEIDGEGGSYTFGRNKGSDSSSYATSKPEGESQISQDTILSNGDKQSLITLANGNQITTTISKDEKTVTTLSDGVTTLINYTTDPLTLHKTLLSQEVTQPSGLKQSVTYSTNYDGNATDTNSKTQTITSNAKTLTTVTDYLNAKTTLTSPEGRVATRNYDKNTRLTTSISSGDLLPTTYSYDDKGRVTSSTTGDRSLNYTYDSKGNVATITDSKNQTTSFTYDIMDRVVEIQYPNNTIEKYTYDNNGNAKKFVTATPTDHTFEYNGVDLKTGYTSPLQKATLYNYDKNRRITSIVKPSNKTITYNYDKDRLASVVTDEGTTNYSYISGTKVASITKGSEGFSFTYDGTLLTSMSQSGILNHTINYSYNNDFAITSMSYGGSSVNYSYDKDGLLLSSGDYTITRDSTNGLATSLSDSTLTQNRAYNGYGELTSLSDNTFGYELSYNTLGEISQKVETINNQSSTYDYSYDNMGRLSEVKKDGVIVEAYTYDNNGNRASATIHNETTNGYYTLDDQIVTYGNNTYQYNDDGYLQSKTTPEGTTTYQYGVFGELQKVVTPTKTIEYLHNANNQRVAKKVDGVIVEKYL